MYPYYTSFLQVKKAYRKKALRYHPDKNPDNASAGKTYNCLVLLTNILMIS